MSRSHIVTSASVVLYVNGTKFMPVIDFHYAAATPRSAKYGLDATDPFELAVTTSAISGSLSLYRLSQDGGAEGAGMTTTLPQISREKYFSLMLIEEHSNTVIFEARRCSVESQAWSIGNRQQVTGTVNFSAIEWSNEIRPNENAASA